MANGMKWTMCWLAVVTGVFMTDAVAMDEKQAGRVARAAVKDQGYPPELAERMIADTAEALVSFPSWTPLSPDAVVSAGGNSWESDANGRTATGTLAFTTTDARDRVADFYARAFAATGEVTQIRTEEPWTIEVVTPDQTETMTLHLERDESSRTGATLRYNRAPVR